MRFLVKQNCRICVRSTDFGLKLSIKSAQLSTCKSVNDKICCTTLEFLDYRSKLIAPTKNNIWYNRWLQKNVVTCLVY